MWIYLSLFLAGGYPIIINFAPSELSFSAGQKYSLLLAIPMSTPLLFYKGWKTGISGRQKSFAKFVGCLLVWAIAYMQLTFFLPWLHVRLLGEPHQELVRIRDRSTSGGVKRGERFTFHVKRMNGTEVRYAVNVPKSVYKSTPHASVLQVTGLRSDLGFLVRDIRRR
jgi:hypothetical protein